MTNPIQRKAALERGVELVKALRGLDRPTDRAFVLTLNAVISDPETSDGQLSMAIVQAEAILNADRRRAEHERARRRDEVVRRARVQAAAEAELNRFGGSVLALQVAHAVRKAAPIEVVPLGGEEERAFRAIVDRVRDGVAVRVMADTKAHVLGELREEAERRQLEGEARSLEEDAAWDERRRRRRRRL